MLGLLKKARRLVWLERSEVGDNNRRKIVLLCMYLQVILRTLAFLLKDLVITL